MCPGIKIQSTPTNKSYGLLTKKRYVPQIRFIEQSLLKHFRDIKNQAASQSKVRYSRPSDRNRGKSALFLYLKCVL